MKIVISPYSRPMRNGAKNPKNFPHWKPLVKKLISLGHEVVQIGAKGEEKIIGDCLFGLPFDAVKKLITEADLWISVDNFLPHLANHTPTRGIVIFGKSDPNIYGYPQNVNILKDRKYLREKQFDIWEAEFFEADVFVGVDEVLEAIKLLTEEKV